MFKRTTVTLVRALIVITLSAAALLATGCSGSDNAGESTTAATVATPPTTAATTTTSRPSTTTSTTSTTATPTTTIDPTAQLIADIEADLNAGEQALLAAGADPSNPVLRADLKRYFSGEALGRTTELVDGWAADGLRVRPNPNVMSILVVYSVSDLDDADNPTLATIEVCRVDAAVVFQPLADGREAIVDDAVYNTVGATKVKNVDGVWRADGGITSTEQVGLTTCVQ